MYENQPFKRSSSVPYERNSKYKILRKSKSEIIDVNQQKNFEGREKSLFHKMIENTLRVTNNCSHQAMNCMSSHKSELFGYWELSQIWDKRKIKGTKSIIKWLNQNHECEVYLRLILTESYRNNISLDIFIELNSSNIKLTFGEQKRIQRLIDELLKEEKMKEETEFFATLKSNHFQWLKEILTRIDEYFVSEKICQKPKLKTVENFSRREINPDYILFPSQACLSWSPHHYLTIIEEKPIPYPRPIIGSLQSIKTLLQNANRNERFARKSRQDDEIEQFKQKREEEEEAKNFNLYQWKIEEQTKFVVFKSGEPLHDPALEQKKSFKKKEQDQSVKMQAGGKREIVIQNKLLGEPRMLTLLRKNRNNIKLYEIPRQAKIKVFNIRSKISRLEDSIIYIYTKIQNEYDGHSLAKVLLKRQFKRELGMFANQFFSKNQQKLPFFTEIQYETIKRTLRGMIQQSSEPTLLYLKCIFLENQYLHSQLQSYFLENFKSLKIKLPFDMLAKLGSYMHFDDTTAEKFLMFMLKDYLIKKFGSLDIDQENQKNEYKLLRNRQQIVKHTYAKNPDKFDDPFYSHKKKQMKSKQLSNIDKYFNHDSVSNNGVTSKIYEGASQKMHQEDLQKLMNKTKNALNRPANANYIPSYILKIYDAYPIKYSLLLNQQQRKNFLKNFLIPLVTLNQNLQGPQQIVIKKALITNAKLINFLDKMNQLIKKFQQKRFTFLQQVITSYFSFHQLVDNPEKSGGKKFYGYCANCSQLISVFNLNVLIKQSCEMPEQCQKKTNIYCEQCRITQDIASYPQDPSPYTQEMSPYIRL